MPRVQAWSVWTNTYFLYTLQQHAEQLPLHPTRAKLASRYDAYSWDNMLLVEQALIAVEEDGQSDLDKSDQPCLLESINVGVL